MVDNVDLFREDSVLERLLEVDGKRREDTDVGKEDSTVMAS